MRISWGLFILLLALMGCKQDVGPKSLPPATQEGKNTFGFKLNEAIWLPDGNSGLDNPYASYDATFHGGSLGISAYVNNNTTNQFISFGGNNISSTGDYILASGPDLPGAVFLDHKAGCEYHQDADSVTGHFVLEKLDLISGIVAGKFDFIFHSTGGCTEISVTEGRFDIRLH